jgi:hypothetical protein
VRPCYVVIGYQRFRGQCYFHFKVETSCSVVVEYHRFRGIYYLHFKVVTARGIVVAYQRFRGIYYLHFKVVTVRGVVVRYQRFRSQCFCHPQRRGKVKSRRRLGGSHGRSGSNDEEKNSYPSMESKSCLPRRGLVIVLSVGSGKSRFYSCIT